ncbi:MAG: D-TA family PLP-dependent enzyme [Planctomycetaceae bacterium]
MPILPIANTRDVVTPALVLFRDKVEANIGRMLDIAGDASRLRPHSKTHKMERVARLQLARGIAKHKCATLAEAEMLAEAGARDILLAYNPVGANVRRVVAFVARYPGVKFAVLADHAKPLDELGAMLSAAGRTVRVLLDLDTGQHRTGVAIGPAAMSLYARIVETPGLEPGGLHVYDGHLRQADVGERAAAVREQWEAVREFRDVLQSGGCPVPAVVAGGTPTFSAWAAIDDPAIECSPGTCVFFDAAYREMCPDLPFEPAAMILTRVVSRPTEDTVTLDLGYKAIASDPPAGSRVVFPDLPDAEELKQNEEHLVIRTSRAAEFSPGDELLAIPRHVCPGVPLHREALVVQNGRIIEAWPVTARDRKLTI